MSDTAMVPLRNALAEVIENDFGLAALLSGRKVYAGLATQGASLNYIVVGQVLRDTDASYLNNQQGRAHKRRLSVWARSSTTAEDIMTLLITLFDHVRLSVSGHTMQTAALDVVLGPVPGDKGDSWGLHADWTVRTLKGAVA